MHSGGWEECLDIHGIWEMKNSEYAYTNPRILESTQRLDRRTWRKLETRNSQRCGRKTYLFPCLPVCLVQGICVTPRMEGSSFGSLVFLRFFKRHRERAQCGYADHFLVRTMGEYLESGLLWKIRKVAMALGPPAVLEQCSAACHSAKGYNGEWELPDWELKKWERSFYCLAQKSSLAYTWSAKRARVSRTPVTVTQNSQESFWKCIINGI